MQSPKHSPLMDLVHKKRLLQEQQPQSNKPTLEESPANPESMPMLVGQPPQADPTEIPNPGPADDIAALLTRMSQLTREVNLLGAQVQDLASKLTAGPATTNVTAGSLGQGNIAGPKWRTEHAVELLKNYTKMPWTKNKLLALAVAKGWRSAEKGHRVIDHMFTTMITNRQYPTPTLVYTDSALQHIIDNAQTCWSLATTVKL